MANLDITRRGILGAMAFAPVVIAAPAVALSPSHQWDQAFAEWKRLNHIAYGGEHECEDACEAETEAWVRLIKTPAPHNEALHWKLDYMFSSRTSTGSCASWDQSLVNHVIADAKRLAGGA